MERDRNEQVSCAHMAPGDVETCERRSCSGPGSWLRGRRLPSKVGLSYLHIAKGSIACGDEIGNQGAPVKTLLRLRGFWQDEPGPGSVSEKQHRW